MLVHGGRRHVRRTQEIRQEELGRQEEQQAGKCRRRRRPVSAGPKLTLPRVHQQSSVDEEPEEMPPPDAETVQVIPGSELIWKITPRPHNSAKVGEQLRELKRAAALCGLTVFVLISLPVLCLLHVRHVPERASQEHGGRRPSDRQSPQTGHPGHGDGRHWYSVRVALVANAALQWRRRHLLVP